MPFLRTMKAKPPLFATALFAGVFLLAGCDEHIRIIRDPDLHIAKHATWAWQTLSEKARVRDSRPVKSRDVIARGETVVRDADSENDALREEVKLAIEQTLTAKGLKKVSDPRDADFVVDFHLAVRRRHLTVERVYPGAYPGLVCGPFGCWEGWGWGPPGVSYEHIRFREGTIVVDVLQEPINHLVYRAVGEKPVRGNMPSFSQEEVNEIVRHLLKDLKPR